MSDIKTIALNYFQAFHKGKTEEVLGYFADGGGVKYGKEDEQPAETFFPETREMIAQLKFQTNGVYTSDETNNVIIHFAFDMPAEDGSIQHVEAIDIIEFDEANKIKRVTVIPNG